MNQLLQGAVEVPPATRREAIVCAERLGKLLDDRWVLREVDMSLPAGSFTVIFGANGAGKSTLLRLIATLLHPSEGRLQLFGGSSRQAAVRSRIGLVGHQPMLYGELTARENLELFGRLYGLPDPRQRAAQMLDEAGLTGRARDPVRSFSRGMVQRMAIARALLHEPELLLADEPFSGLDAPAIAALERTLGELHGRSATIVLTSHEIARGLALAQRAIVLRGGRVVVDRPCSDLTPGEVLAEVSGR